MEYLLIALGVVPYVFILIHLFGAALTDSDTKETKYLVWAIFWLLLLIHNKVF